MGKPTGFMDIERKTASKQAIDERLKTFKEMYNWLSEDEMKEQAARCMNCGTPFCHGSGCPLGNSIPEFNDLVFRGRWKEAAERLHLTNNFPDVTGRICPALCEASCVVGLADKAVSIREIELTIVEKAWAEGWVKPMPPVEKTGKKVAVVGSGPAGLAAAQQLCRAGHDVTLYEKADRPGGILRYGIPDFKLEKMVIDRRVEQMKAEGVKFECGVDAGVDVSADELKKKFDAIVLTGGAMEPRDLSVPGREAEGIYQAMKYLIQQNRRVAGDKIPADEEILATGKDVLIIGGGDTGSDCLGTALRQGANSVEQFELMPVPPEGRDEETTPWPLWPYMLRTSSSHEEGGHRRWSVATDNFIVEGGKVKGLKGHEVKWTQDKKTGKWSMENVEGSDFEIKADLVVLAMGFVKPVHSGLLDGLGVEYDPRGNVKSNPATYMSSVDGVFTAGDMQTGAWLVVGAIAGGRKAARQVDLYLMGESALPEVQEIPKMSVFVTGA
ncbi:MAG: glutamate synthase subunit beta [Planctomycetes bacterium]|nr:glutamate synthase subunit beta [Planctomycetota bacterium]